MTDNFWNRVLDLLDRQEISRKEFAMRIGISYSSIHNGATLGSIPSADIALRIAYELHTSLEYLVYGSEQFSDTDIAPLSGHIVQHGTFFTRKKQAYSACTRKYAATSARIYRRFDFYAGKGEFGAK